MSPTLSRRSLLGVIATGTIAGCIGDDTSDGYLCRRTPTVHFDTDKITLDLSQPDGVEKTQAQFSLEPGVVERIEAKAEGETKAIDVDEDAEGATLDWDHGEMVENLTVTYVAYDDGEEIGRAEMRNHCEWE